MSAGGDRAGQSPPAQAQIATELLRRGAGLPEIGEVPRHQSIEATAGLPRSTAKRCRDWRCRGPGAGHERAL